MVDLRSLFTTLIKHYCIIVILHIITIFSGVDNIHWNPSMTAKMKLIKEGAGIKGEVGIKEEVGINAGAWTNVEVGIRGGAGINEEAGISVEAGTNDWTTENKRNNFIILPRNNCNKFQLFQSSTVLLFKIHKNI